MRLYHFTAIEYLPEIAADGLWKGEVPLSHKKVANAVWLTDDTSPKTHGLTRGRYLTREERAWYEHRDPLLSKWSVWAPRNGVKVGWLRTLNKTAGGGSGTWWIYHGTIPAERLEAFDMETGEPIAEWWTKLERVR